MIERQQQVKRRRRVRINLRAKSLVKTRQNGNVRNTNTCKMLAGIISMSSISILQHHQQQRQYSILIDKRESDLFSQRVIVKVIVKVRKTCKEVSFEASKLSISTFYSLMPLECLMCYILVCSVLLESIKS